MMLDHNERVSSTGDRVSVVDDLLLVSLLFEAFGSRDRQLLLTCSEHSHKQRSRALQERDKVPPPPKL